jgi:hypothetical protein
VRRMEEFNVGEILYCASYPEQFSNPVILVQDITGASYIMNRICFIV